eukprot:TRINITY_DN4958_c0_g1_i1.p1 TRINITY_DN4958_c0_g1~~TRINITY_DN4958_c0_g1_i1.p1  ORF type:complete len:570 (+),score=127.57 TRINITY_DN4958_c0_g1_i1:55-1764(+)
MKEEGVFTCLQLGFASDTYKVIDYFKCYPVFVLVMQDIEKENEIITVGVKLGNGSHENFGKNFQFEKTPDFFLATEKGDFYILCEDTLTIYNFFDQTSRTIVTQSIKFGPIKQFSCVVENYLVLVNKGRFRILILDLNSGESVFEFTTGILSCLEVTKNYVIIAAGREIIIVDYKNEFNYFIIDAESLISSIAFSEEKQVLIYALFEGNVLSYSIRTGKKKVIKRTSVSLDKNIIEMGGNVIIKLFCSSNLVCACSSNVLSLFHLGDTNELEPIEKYILDSPSKNFYYSGHTYYYLQAQPQVDFNLDYHVVMWTPSKKEFMERKYEKLSDLSENIPVENFQLRQPELRKTRSNVDVKSFANKKSEKKESGSKRKKRESLNPPTKPNALLKSASLETEEMVLPSPVMTKLTFRKNKAKKRTKIKKKNKAASLNKMKAFRATSSIEHKIEILLSPSGNYVSKKFVKFLQESYSGEVFYFLKSIRLFKSEEDPISRNQYARNIGETYLTTETLLVPITNRVLEKVQNALLLNDISITIFDAIEIELIDFISSKIVEWESSLKSDVTKRYHSQ